jgi:hypothetical protein
MAEMTKKMADKVRTCVVSICLLHATFKHFSVDYDCVKEQHVRVFTIISYISHITAVK